MVDLELIFGFIAIAIPIFIYLDRLSNKIVAVETKMNCMLEWVITVDPTSGDDKETIRSKRNKLKDNIEQIVNGDGCLKGNCGK